MKISFIVYGEPVAKGRPRFFRHGNHVQTCTPEKTEIAEHDFKFQSIQHKPGKPILDPVILDIRIYRSIPKSMSKKRQILAHATC